MLTLDLISELICMHFLSSDGWLFALWQVFSLWDEIQVSHRLPIMPPASPPLVEQINTFAHRFELISHYSGFGPLDTDVFLSLLTVILL